MNKGEGRGEEEGRKRERDVAGRKRRKEQEERGARRMREIRGEREEVQELNRRKIGNERD